MRKEKKRIKEITKREKRRANFVFDTDDKPRCSPPSLQGTVGRGIVRERSHPHVKTVVFNPSRVAYRGHAVLYQSHQHHTIHMEMRSKRKLLFKRVFERVSQVTSHPPYRYREICQSTKAVF